MSSLEAPTILQDLEAGAEPMSLGRARHLPSLRIDGRAPDLATVWRWSQKGLKLPSGERIRLEVLSIGGRRVTTAQAIMRFIEASNPDRREQPPGRSPRQQQQAASKAVRDLKAEGF